MSIKQMSEAWRVQDVTLAQKLVLLKLCDNANDGGYAYPSIDHVARACCCNRTTVMRAIHDLEKMGALTINQGGRGRSNSYTVTPHKVVAESDQSQKATSRTEQPEVVAESDQSGCRKRPKPSRTVNEPSMPYASPEFHEAWQDWLEFKRQKKQKMPPTTVKRQLNQLRKWGEARAIAAIEQSITNNWTGLFEPKSGANVTRPLFESNNYQKNGIQRRPYD